MQDDVPQQLFDHYQLDLERYSGSALPYAIGRLFERYRWHIRLAVLFAEGAADDCPYMGQRHNRQCGLARKVHAQLTASWRHSGLDSRFDALEILSEIHDSVSFHGEGRYDEVENAFDWAYRYDQGQRADHDICASVLSHSCDASLREVESFFEDALELGQRKLYLLGRTTEQGLCPPSFWRQPRVEINDEHVLPEDESTAATTKHSEGETDVSLPCPDEPCDDAEIEPKRDYLICGEFEPGAVIPARNWPDSVRANLQGFIPQQHEIITGLATLQKTTRLRQRHVSQIDELVRKIDAIVSQQFRSKPHTSVSSRVALILTHKATASTLSIAYETIRIERFGYPEPAEFGGDFAYTRLLESVFQKQTSYSPLNDLIRNIWSPNPEDISNHRSALHKAVERANKKLAKVGLRIVAKRNLPQDWKGRWAGDDGYVLVDPATVFSVGQG